MQTVSSSFPNGLGLVVAIVVSLVVGFALGFLTAKQKRLFEKGISNGRKSADKKEGAVEIYVGNLSYDVSEKDVAGLFEPFGRIVEVRLIQHKNSGRSKGFGFVVMQNRSEAEKAIRTLHNTEMNGRRIVVNEAHSRSER